MNEAPEIVCDVLYYLTGFVHYRTDQFSREVYEKFLRQQNLRQGEISQEQEARYNEDGWRHDELGINARMNDFCDYVTRFRYHVHAKATP